MTTDTFKVENATIVPALPGYSVAKFYSDGHNPPNEAGFNYEPVVAWRIMVDGDEQYTMPVTPGWENLGDDCKSAVRYPDGSFRREGRWVFENEAKALKYFIEDADCRAADERMMAAEADAADKAEWKAGWAARKPNRQYAEALARQEFRTPARGDCRRYR